MILKSTKLYEKHVKQILYNNICFAGGCSKVKNFPNFLKDDIENMNEEKGINYHVCKNIAKPEFQAWIGGSIISKLPFANIYWITQSEF